MNCYMYVRYMTSSWGFTPKSKWLSAVVPEKIWTKIFVSDGWTNSTKTVYPFIWTSIKKNMAMLFKNKIHQYDLSDLEYSKLKRIVIEFDEVNFEFYTLLSASLDQCSITWFCIGSHLRVRKLTSYTFVLRCFHGVQNTHSF